MNNPCKSLVISVCLILLNYSNCFGWGHWLPPCKLQNSVTVAELRNSQFSNLIYTENGFYVGGFYAKNSNYIQYIDVLIRKGYLTIADKNHLLRLRQSNLSGSPVPYINSVFKFLQATVVFLMAFKLDNEANGVQGIVNIIHPKTYDYNYAFLGLLTGILNVNPILARRSQLTRYLNDREFNGRIDSFINNIRNIIHVMHAERLFLFERYYNGREWIQPEHAINIVSKKSMCELCENLMINQLTSIQAFPFADITNLAEAPTTYKILFACLQPEENREGPDNMLIKVPLFYNSNNTINAIPAQSTRGIQFANDVSRRIRYEIGKINGRYQVKDLGNQTLITSFFGQAGPANATTIHAAAAAAGPAADTVNEILRLFGTLDPDARRRTAEIIVGIQDFEADT